MKPTIALQDSRTRTLSRAAWRWAGDAAVLVIGMAAVGVFCVLVWAL
jgi:hypothetical protein